MFRDYVKRKWALPISLNDKQSDDVADYLFQTLMRDGTTENAPMINFNLYMSAHIPLGSGDKIRGYKKPISFIYGDNDWVHILEGDIAETVVKNNKHYKEGLLGVDHS